MDCSFSYFFKEALLRRNNEFMLQGLDVTPITYICSCQTMKNSMHNIDEHFNDISETKWYTASFIWANDKDRFLKVCDFK